MNAPNPSRLNGECVAVPFVAPHLWRRPQLAVMLGMSLIGNPLRLRRMRIAACAGWGYALSGRMAARRAARRGLPLLRLEDGFLRSIRPGLAHPPLSIVIDDTGLYYDATRPSGLESLVSRQRSPEEAARARSLVSAWRAGRVSKYNHAPELPRNEIAGPFVLVADQTLADSSIRYGLADALSFQRMLAAALDENPDCTVLVKIHPDVFAGRKRGYFNVAAISKIPRVRVLGEDVHPVSLIEGAEAVYVVTSQVGFEGLLWGKPVRTFGMPFYAGWGLTRDELAAPARRRAVPLESLVYAALVEYPRYIDPETGERCEPERLIEWVAAQRNTMMQPRDSYFDTSRQPATTSRYMQG